MKIIELNIKTAQPIGSKTLINSSNLNISSATARNEMSLLESEGFLEKSHVSSGRIPSKKGYEFYAKYTLPSKNKMIEEKLQQIFSHRRAFIDFTLDEAAKSITNIANFALVTSNNNDEELMKSIHLTPINENVATIVIVTSSGRVESKTIEFNNFLKIHDVRIAIRLFKERLVDTKLNELAQKAKLLSPILSRSIKNYELLIQQFVIQVFNFHKKIYNKIYGNQNIIKSDIKRDDLANLIELMQNKSIFHSIEGQFDEDEKIKIDIRPNNTSILSTRISHHNKVTELSIIGSNRMDYLKAKTILKLLKKFLGEEK